MRMNTERYPRLREMLSCGCPFQQPERDKVMREIFHSAVSELAGRPEAEYTDTQLLTAVSAGMGAYLQSYRAQPVFKQKIREKFLEWLHAIGGKYHVELEDVQVDWVIPVQRDSGVELVRLLHDRNGLTKRQFRMISGGSTLPCARKSPGRRPSRFAQPVMKCACGYAATRCPVRTGIAGIPRPTRCIRWCFSST